MHREIGWGLSSETKFRVKLPNPRDKISIQSSPAWKSFEFKVTHQTENFKPSEVKNVLAADKTILLIVLVQ